ncbi:uridylate kinase [Methylobacterium sp. A49B]|uniref:Uridylate kinase n=1 Tax=Methylobacterium mesophilicum SR1.6/6 TaxID=908290 RepID=A0A6B9FPG5_9HYPH|nr:aspartate/glutamate/uridylate kinase [Methylobacterium mesophilicum]QGY02878.1 uridylate kinase [Methylobacterium mesophilicum SR1.6/6]
MTVIVKVGGSLEADPHRRRALLARLADGTHGRCIIVPGGGTFAGAVRAAQMREGFSDAEAHRRALDAMSDAAGIFRGIEPRLVQTFEPWAEAGSATARVWNPRRLRAGHPDIPETWDVTSDSLALWLAGRIDAESCVLVKSRDAAPAQDAAALAQDGLVDAAFPSFAARYAGRIEIWGPSGPVPVTARAAA